LREYVNEKIEQQGEKILRRRKAATQTRQPQTHRAVNLKEALRDKG